ncbi:hypothetical protein E4U43_000922 [Claviceps pusilla]|uniref:Uncharacterized protein n=1 Tax=Claviceps pusilla TaxID=123648 RepID=A0A9P7N8Y6_9HYPO|nr:hypothetical protein E4U43_000922 [Claviceps pusilla]
MAPSRHRSTVAAAAANSFLSTTTPVSVDELLKANNVRECAPAARSPDRPPKQWKPFSDAVVERQSF